MAIAGYCERVIFILLPDPLDRNGRRCEKEPEPRPNGPSQKVFNGMRVQGCRSDGKYPLMVLLVNVLVDGLVMKKPEILPIYLRGHVQMTSVLRGGGGVTQFLTQ